MTKILGFAGKKRSGKSSAANFVVGNILTHLVNEDNLPLISYFKMDADGKLVVPSELEPKLVYNTETGAWDPSETQSEANFDIAGQNPAHEEWLAQNVWPTVKIYSLATPIKSIGVSLLGLDREFLFGNKKDGKTHIMWESIPVPREHVKSKRFLSKKGPMTGREVMKYLGTEVFRAMYSECFVKYIFKQIELDAPQIAIIDDARFENEITPITQSGGVCIGLTRSVASDSHSSEQLDLEKLKSLCTFVVDNAEIDMAAKNSQIGQFLMESNFFGDVVEQVANA